MSTAIELSEVGPHDTIAGGESGYVGASVQQIVEVPCRRVIHPRADARQVDNAKVQELKETLQRFGLLNPIILRRAEVWDQASWAEGYELIAGRHRHRAAIELGWETIPARVIEADDIEAELAMISENLHRSDLTALQRSQGVARWVCLTTESRKDEKRQVDAKPGRPTGGVRGAARELGISEPDARRSLKIASLPQEVQAAAVTAGLDDNATALLTAAREGDPEKQIRVLRKWDARKDVAAAKAALARKAMAPSSVECAIEFDVHGGLREEIYREFALELEQAKSDLLEARAEHIEEVTRLERGLVKAAKANQKLIRQLELANREIERLSRLMAKSDHAVAA